jgi:hypothetical protein
MSNYRSASLNRMQSHHPPHLRATDALWPETAGYWCGRRRVWELEFLAGQPVHPEVKPTQSHRAEKGSVIVQRRDRTIIVCTEFA